MLDSDEAQRGAASDALTNSSVWGHGQLTFDEITDVVALRVES
jgi:hypothetical protein